MMPKRAGLRPKGNLSIASDDFDQEIARTRSNKELMAFLETSAKHGPTVPLDEVKRQLGLSDDSLANAGP